MKKLFFCLLVVLFFSACTIFSSQQKMPAQENNATKGVSDNEIILGSSSALSGHAGYLGTSYISGAMSYIKQINEEGGVYGRKIKVISYDDQYDPPKCIVNTQRLINDDEVFALFNYVGTPTSVRVIPMIEEAKIPLIGLFTGANILREPLRKYIFNIRASYYQEMSMAVEHFVEHLELSKIAVFYQADAYGMDGLEGVKIALNKYDLTPVALGSYARGSLDVEKAVDIIVESGAEAVIMVGTYSPSAKFIKLASQEDPNLFFLSVSFVGSEELVYELGEYGEDVFITQVVPSPQNLQFEGVGEYIKNLKKYYPSKAPSYGGFEGYINAKIMVEGLRRAGKDLTRIGFVEAIESIKNYSVGINNTISFSENDHQGSDAIYFTVLRDKKLISHSIEDDKRLINKARK